MKKFIPLILSAMISFAGYGQVTSSKIYIKDFQYNDDRLEIIYGFNNVKPAAKYHVWLEIYSEKGNKIPCSSLKGDIGMVVPSGEKKITWLPANDQVNIEEKITLKIFATEQIEPKPGKAYLYSTLYPGAGHRQVGGNNKLYLGIIGYAGIGGAIAFNSMAAAALADYRVEQDPAKSVELMDKATFNRNISIACAGVSAAVWALDYFLISRTASKAKNRKPGEIEMDVHKSDLLSFETQPKFISTRGLPPNLFADLAFNDANGNGIVEAGEKAEINITLSNQGKGNAMNLNVQVTDNFSDPSLKTGQVQEIPVIAPGGSVKITIPITTDMDLKTAEHKLQINVTEKYGYDMDPAYLVMQSFAYQHAKMAYSGMEILDSGQGTFAISEDGQLQPGESVIAKIMVQNIGQGIANNVTYTVTTTDNNIFLRDNTGTLGSINPGEVKEIFFNLSPNKRVAYKDKLPVFLDLKEEKQKGNLTAFQLPVQLNQKPPKSNIMTVSSDVESLTRNIARFEYSSKKFTAITGNVINIKAVAPSKTKRNNAVAVVMGVSRYENMAPAPYADNDASIMKEYFEKVLGIKQVLLFTNAEVTISRMNKIFNPEYGELQKAVVKGETEVFVFFSGHGVPDKSGENTYLFPYDGVKEDLETFSYNTTRLYENLSKLGAAKVTVILDACFSGSSRKTDKVKEENLVAQKGVRLKPQKPWKNNSTFNMISSSTGEETSLGFDPSETGLFTYYFCAGLQGKSDLNNDKKITLSELNQYVTGKVTEHSKKISGIQTPEFEGDENMVLVEF